LSNTMLKSQSWQPVALGDVAVASRSHPQDWHCQFWRGPFCFNLTLYGRVEGAAMDDFNGKPEEGKRNAMIAAIPQVGLEYGKAILDSFEAWYRRPFAGGPGLKGLYWPLHVGKYRLKPEEVPAGLILMSTQAKGPEWSEREEQDLDVEVKGKPKRSYSPGTWCDLNIIIQASYPKQDDTKVEAPLIRAKEAMDEKLTSFRNGSLSADRQAIGPVRLALAGADEAVEIMVGWKPSDDPNWRPGTHGHLVIARRANVLVIVRHSYSPEKTMTPSAWAQKLAELMLAKIAADKPAPPAPATK
jgi:hypothetical protein